MLNEPAESLRTLIVVPRERLEEVRRFYMRGLGFEEESTMPCAGDGDAFLLLRHGRTRLILATPGAHPPVPRRPSEGLVMLIACSDPGARRRGLVAAGEVEPGPLQALGDARLFVVFDPLGHAIWFVRHPS